LEAETRISKWSATAPTRKPYAKSMRLRVRPLRVRNAAEESRVATEHDRRAVANEVTETITTLTALLNRMEAVEALRRDARKDTP